MSALDGQAGAPAVHALGRARLGQLRPGADGRTSARGIDAKGNLTAFEFTDFGIPYCTTQPAEQQVSGQRRRSPRPGGRRRRSAARSTTSRTGASSARASRSQDNYFKVTFLRAPNNPQSAFAAEQAVDELAYMAKMDPVAFRLQNIANRRRATPPQRWKNVLDERGQGRELAAEGRGLEPLDRQRRHGPRRRVRLLLEHDDVLRRRHRGQQEDRQDHRQARCTWRGDAGLIVYPAGARTTRRARRCRASRRALVEQVVFDKKGVTSLDWVTLSDDAVQGRAEGHYPWAHPHRRAGPRRRPGSRTTGSGEPALSPVPAAVANAFFDATGVRIREAPMTPGRVRAVLRAAGK